VEILSLPKNIVEIVKNGDSLSERFSPKKESYNEGGTQCKVNAGTQCKAWINAGAWQKAF